MDSKAQLEQLEKREKELRPIIFKSFKTSEELQGHKVNNQLIFDEYYTLTEEIEQLEWQLKSPQEQQELIEYRKMLEEKHSKD